jgi:hypothetical protein
MRSETPKLSTATSASARVACVGTFRGDSRVDVDYSPVEVRSTLELKDDSSGIVEGRTNTNFQHLRLHRGGALREFTEGGNLLLNTPTTLVHRAVAYIAQIARRNS